MSLLLMSACVTIAAAVRSLMWYLAVVLFHDGLRRGGYHGSAAGLDDWADTPDPAREELRRATRRRMTAVGESFSEFLQPSDKPRLTGGNPSRTNPFVNAIAIAAVVVGAGLFAAAAVCGAYALRDGLITSGTIEIAIGAAGILTGLLAARYISAALGRGRAHPAGFLAILISGVLGAVCGALLMRLCLCNLPWSRGLAREWPAHLNS